MNTNIPHSNKAFNTIKTVNYALNMQKIISVTFGILVPAPILQTHFLQNAAKHL